MSLSQTQHQSLLTSTFSECLLKFNDTVEKYIKLDKGKHNAHALIMQLNEKLKKLLKLFGIKFLPVQNSEKNNAEPVASSNHIYSNLSRHIAACTSAIRNELSNNSNIDEVVALFSAKKELEECNDLLRIFSLCNLEDSRYRI